MGGSVVHIRDRVDPVCIGKRALAGSQKTQILDPAVLLVSFVTLSKLFKFSAFYLSSEVSSSSKILIPSGCLGSYPSRTLLSSVQLLLWILLCNIASDIIVTQTQYVFLSEAELSSHGLCQRVNWGSWHNSDSAWTFQKARWLTHFWVPIQHASANSFPPQSSRNHPISCPSIVQAAGPDLYQRNR